MPLTDDPVEHPRCDLCDQFTDECICDEADVIDSNEETP